MTTPALVRRWLLAFALAMPLVLAAAQTPPPVPTPTAPPQLPAFPAVRRGGIPAPTNQARSAVINPFAAPKPVKLDPTALAFDALQKNVQLKPGERSGLFTFTVTNASKEEVVIHGIQTSCGCTAGKLPKQPWPLAPGETGEISFTMDMTGKFGTVTKTGTINTSAGPFILTLSSTAAPVDPKAMQAGDRMRNLQVAAADRQAIFRGDCANCHVHPTTGKVGKELYTTACGICHDAEHKASMVPWLRDPKRATDRNYWTKWISEGREGSLMAAFALNKGGILTDAQITSLVDYLEGGFKEEVKAGIQPGEAHPEPVAAPTQAQ